MSASKIRSSVFILPLLAILLAACAAPAPTAAPIPLATVPVATTVPVPATAAPGATAAPAATAGASDTGYPAAPTAAAASPAPATGYPAASSPTAPTGGGSVTYELVPANSEASYSIREQLAQRNLPSDAIGKTQAVAGSITINADGTIDSANSKFTVEVGTLKSDSSMRDGFVSRNILQTSQYPQVVFVPTAVTGLPAALPASGTVTFKVTGDLTIRDVTKPVTWDVTGTVANGEATGTATTTFTFEDFNLSQPKVSVVLSVEDKITLTMKVDLKPKGQ